MWQDLERDTSFSLWPILFSRKSWYVSARVRRILSVIDPPLNRLEASDKRTAAAFTLLISGTLLVTQKPQGEVQFWLCLQWEEKWKL